MPDLDFESSLEYRFLKQSNSEFHEMEQHFMRDHLEAMECRDCEEFIKKACEVCGWFYKAQETISYGVRKGWLEYTPGRSHNDFNL